MRILLLCLFGFFVPTFLASGEERLWMSVSGKSLFGTLERATSTHAIIKSSEGKTVYILITRLDESGRNFVADWKREQAVANIPKAGRTLPGHTNRRTNVKSHLRAGATGLAEKALAEKINAIRQKHGLKPLRYDEEAAAVARAHSENMVKKTFFAHEDPDGLQVWDRLKAAKVSNSGSGENIAVNNHSNPGEVAASGWMDSPGHRANILLPTWTRTGMGIAKGPDGAVYFTQVFLR